MVQYEDELRSHYWQKKFLWTPTLVEGKWAWLRSVEQRLCIIGIHRSMDKLRFINPRRRKRIPNLLHL